MTALLVTLLLAAVPVVLAINGGDVSQLYSVSTYQCCKDQGWEFMVARSYHSYGGIDPNGKTNVENAAAAGIKYHDVYHFPCYGKVSAEQQMQDDINYAKGSFGMLWFDIETNSSPGCGWSADHSDNCNFLGALIAEGQRLGVKMGVYSSSYMWSSIMGDGCTVGASNGLPIWYAHYDHNPSFSDFQGFGGWTKPNVKQYWDSVGICGISADADWYPA